MKLFSIFCAQKSKFSQILCCVLERIIHIWNPIKFGRKGQDGSSLIKAAEIMTVSMESRPTSSGISSQDSLSCSSVVKSMIFWATWEKHQKYTGRILFMSIQWHLLWQKRQQRRMFGKCRVVKVLAKKFSVGQWSFAGPGSEKKWCSGENSPQGAWDHIADEMLLEFAESGHPTFRATTPLSRGILNSKGHGKLSMHFTADCPTIETVFGIIISANQLSIYGAAATFCEEFEIHQDGSGELDVLMGQSIVLGEILAEILLQNENSSNHQILWQQYMERIESLSPENKVSRFCMEAGFMRVGSGTAFQDQGHWWFQTSSFSGLSWIHSCPRRSSFTIKKDGFKETWELGLY